MTKKWFLALFFALLAGNAFSQVQYKVVCCDGTVHYTHGVSMESYWSSGASITQLEEYHDIIGASVCKGRGTCHGKQQFQSVSEVKPNGNIVRLSVSLQNKQELLESLSKKGYAELNMRDIEDSLA